MNIDSDQRVMDRISRADAYDERTGNQPKWYSLNASKNKNRFQLIGIFIIILGAFIGVIPLLFSSASEPTTPEILTAIMGALIVILKGIERISLPEENWRNYRKASEALKRERECYVEAIHPYTSLHEEGAYSLYVKRCILIKAEEQNNFWGLGEETGKENKSNTSKNT